jgi:hypothetical protein
MKKLIFLFLWLISTPLSAATYYVSPTGNNGNLGTIGSPWLTPQHAEGVAVAGDIVYFRSGTYNNQFVIYTHNGTTGNPITFQAYPGEYPVISGSGITLGAGSGIVMIYSDYINFIGFEVKNSNETGLTVSGPHCLISNCTVHDIMGGGIGAYSDADYTIIEYCTVYNCSMSNSDDIRQTDEYWGEAIDIRGSSGTELIENCIVRHCVVHDHHGEGIGVIFGNIVTIENNVLYDIYAPLMYSRNSKHCLWQRNFAYMTRIMGDGASYGIAIWNEGGDAYVNSDDTYINNIVYGTICNIAVWSYVNMVIENNTFVNTSTYEIGFGNEESFTGSHFENNIIIQEGGLPCVDVPSGSGMIFSHNLYNKAYDTDAAGTGDVTSTLTISKTGVYTSNTYYKLLSNSAAVNTGTDIGVDYDFGENARGVIPDIGAWELENPAVEPVVIVIVSVSAGTSNATIGNNVTYDGGGTVTDRGVCWALTVNPTTSASHTHDGTGAGIFNSYITGLTANTTYHIRAYAVNSAGPGYSADQSFTTGIDSGLSGDFVFSGGKPVFVKIGGIWKQVIK